MLRPKNDWELKRYLTETMNHDVFVNYNGKISNYLLKFFYKFYHYCAYIFKNNRCVTIEQIIWIVLFIIIERAKLLSFNIKGYQNIWLFITSREKIYLLY